MRAGLTTFFTMAYIIAVNVSRCFKCILTAADPPRLGIYTH